MMKTTYSLLTAEFLGTFVLVYTVGCNIVGHTGVWGVTSIACSLMVMIYALGAVSGAHFNPAVTVACLCAKKIEFGTAMEYIIVQVIAAMMAGFANSAVYGHAVGPVANQGEYTMVQALSAEFMYTLMLTFVVLNVACTEKNQPNDYYGIAIGFVVVAGGYGAGQISGGCFNPAIALGLDMSSMHPKWGMAYAGVECLGGVVAALFHRIIRSEDYAANVADRKADSGLLAKLLAEAVGTGFLCFTVATNVATSSPMGAWSIAASLMCMIYALGSVSGAHFNPAVTIAIALSGRDKIDPMTAVLYIIAQMVGGIDGMLKGCWVSGAKTFGPLGEPTRLGDTGFSTLQEAGMESIFTFILCFTVLCVATTKDPSKDMFGLAIGSCVTVGGTAVGALTGGCLNPAVATGVAVATAVYGKGDAFGAIGQYIGFELLGAAVAAGLFYATHIVEYQSPKQEEADQNLIEAESEAEEVA